MPGKTCLVTGANAGIGKETVAGLAARGARVLMVCRNRGRGERAIQEIRQRIPGSDLELLLADLSRIRQVRDLIAAVERRTDRLDVLVSNAGVYSVRRRETDEGYEQTFAVNHLAPFVLVRGLLEVLRRSAPARVVVVASAAHFRGTIAFDDLHAEERRYSGWRAYCQSKLANVLFAAELARRVPASEVTANSLHPGVVATKLLLRGRVPMWLARPWTITPEEGAKTPYTSRCHRTSPESAVRTSTTSKHEGRRSRRETRTWRTGCGPSASGWRDVQTAMNDGRQMSKLYGIMMKTSEST